MTFEITGGVAVFSIITKESAGRSGRAQGNEVYAVVKAGDVMVAGD